MDCAASLHACLQAAANLYIPRSAGSDGASKWDNDKAGRAPVSTPASGAEIGMASPFEGMKFAGDPQKPGKAPEEVCGTSLRQCRRGSHHLHTQGTKSSQFGHA